MQYLVQMKLATSGRPTSVQEGANFIEESIFPTLELCKKLQEEKKILAGGVMRIAGPQIHNPTLAAASARILAMRSKVSRRRSVVF